MSKRNVVNIETKSFEIENSRSDNIFRSLKIFLLINKLFMVAPYSVHISHTNNRKFKVVNKYDVIYYIRCIFAICICCYGLTYYITMAARLKVVQAFLNTISIALLVPFVFLTRNQFKQMLQKLSELEIKLTQYGIFCNYKKLFRLSIFQLISILLISIVSQALVTPEYMLIRKFSLFVLFVFPNILTSLFLCQYINVVMILSDWLENLNEYFLKELLLIEFDAINKINNARQIFHWLWELAGTVEQVFQLPVIIVLGTTFINTAAFVYLWIIVAKINPSTYFWFFSNIFKISVLPLMCEICRKKDVNIRVTIQKITSLKFGQLRYENSINTLDFSMLLAHAKIAFHCCGMFPLDLTWVFSMVAAVSIYVVIFLQNNFNG